MWPFKRSNSRCSKCRVDIISGELLSQFPNLTFEQKLKFGELWRCQNCETPWFLTAQRKRIARIATGYLPLVSHWNETPLPLSSFCVATVARIGGFFDDWDETVIVPCALKTTDGQWFDKAILRVTKTPPYWWYPHEKVFWAGQIEQLRPSDFALSLQVRRTSHEKAEESMGFAPVDVQTQEGRSFTLGCRSDFFDQEEIKGSQLELAPRPRKRTVVWPTETQAYIWADWNDELAEEISAFATT